MGNIEHICESCSKEYRNHKKRSRFCSIPCYRKWQSQRMSGSNNPAYKGGIAIYTNGSNYGYSQKYIRGSRNRQPEHRVLMEQFLNRKLKPNEVVHHINGNPLDNRIKNLIVMTKKQHAANHLKESPMNIHNLLNRIAILEKENNSLKQNYHFERGFHLPLSMP